MAAAATTAGIAIPGGLKSVVYTDFVQTANNAVIPTLVGIAVHIVVSLLTPPTSPSFEQVANMMQQERSAVEEEAQGRLKNATRF